MNSHLGKGSIAGEEKRADQETAMTAGPPAHEPNADEAATTGDNFAASIRAAESAGEPLAPPGARRLHVHVAAGLHDLIAGIPITPEEAQALQRRRRLNSIIHSLLIAGLVVSTSIMLLGLALDVILHRRVPGDVTRLSEVATRIRSLRPSGFLSLGLLVLIATPILRVVGSFAAFVYERDWRYAGITFLVLLILFVSLLSGRG